MKHLIVAFLVLAFALSACAPGAGGPVDGNTPVNSDDPSAPNMEGYDPQPGDSTLTRGPVYLESADLLTMESYPLQFMLVMKGSLPTPCHQLRVVVGLPDEEKRINVDVYSVSDPDEICIQVLESFETNIPLGSFPEGRYSLWINGEMSAEFDA